MTPDEFEALRVDARNELAVEKEAEDRYYTLAEQAAERRRKAEKVVRLVEGIEEILGKKKTTVARGFELREWMLDLFEVQAQYNKPHQEFGKWVNVTGFEAGIFPTIYLSTDDPDVYGGRFRSDTWRELRITRKQPTFESSPR